MVISVPEMLTPKEIADILKISYEASLAFIKYSGIDYHRIGNQYRVSAEKLRAFLNKKGPTHTDLTGGG
jgi:excisionase family DNA binding protein